MAAPAVPAETLAVPSLDVRDLNVQTRWSTGPLAVAWSGWWWVDGAGDHRLVVESDGPVRVTVDGVAAVDLAAGRARGSVALAPGAHALAVAYRGAGEPRRLRVEWAPPGGTRRAFAGGSVFREPPRWAEVRRGRWAVRLAWAAAALWLLSLLALVMRGGPRARAVLRVALPALVVLYAGALRFEALMGRYGWQGPRWAVGAARAVEALHPDGLRWEPATEDYGGDPLTYLRRARSMRGFFDADVREPLFPFTTRLLLVPLHDRPLAVNAASALFSTLCVLATYLLGAAAFSRGVGLGAALCLALDRDALWWGVEGFRDDAFAFFAVLTVWLLWRLRERPTPGRGALAGVAAGAACLSRITAFSFLLPVALWLLVERGESKHARRRALGAAGAALLAVAGPYMLACAVAYHDPFYAVNFHTRFYRSRTGQAYDTDMSWHGYLRRGFAAGSLLETGVRGLTTYPFSNKWAGLDPVTPWLRRLLAPLAVLGLLLFLRSPAGRLLLVALLGALLPYAFTWRIPGGAEWRFTLVAYPFYLVAAWAAVAGLVRLLRPRPGAPAP